MNQGNELLREQAEQLRKNLDVLADRLDEISQLRSTQAATSTVQINAGGVGIWVCAMCATVSLLVTFALVVLVVDHSRKIDELNTYVTATYMMAPHLKEQVEK